MFALASHASKMALNPAQDYLPSPKAYKKSPQGGLLVSTLKDNCEEDLADSFQLLPDDDSMECCEPSQH